MNAKDTPFDWAQFDTDWWPTGETYKGKAPQEWKDGDRWEDHE